jgi:hypothetical protein
MAQSVMNSAEVPRNAIMRHRFSLRTANQPLNDISEVAIRMRDNQIYDCTYHRDPGQEQLEEAQDLVGWMGEGARTKTVAMKAAW